jgi:putative ABC transport system permease protein
LTTVRETIMREWLTRVIDWMRRDRLDAELAEELRFHRDRLEQDARVDGSNAREAEAAARRRLGNTIRAREDARERWSLPWLDHLQQDVRYALRGLRRAPGFTASVVLTLGLGLGANAAMFSVIDTLMLRPHPYLRDPATAHRVYLRSLQRDRETISSGTEYTRFLDLRRWATTVSHSAGLAHFNVAIGIGTAARERLVGAVSASYFDFFDARPVLGRFFVPAEDTTPVGARVVVLDYGFWKSELGGRNVIGETLQVGNYPCTIIGVAPEGFHGVAEGRPPSLYMPITTFAGNQPGADGREYFINYNWGWMEMIVRRKAGVTIEAVNADLTNAYIRSWNAERAITPRQTPVEIARPSAIASAIKTAAGPRPRLEAKTAVWVGGVAAMVLLIACANVANLFLARTLRRRREVALRVALGVSRGRLAAQSLTESIVLALFGGMAGVLIAQWGGILLRRAFIPNWSGLDPWVDPRTLGVAIAAALFAGVMTGMAPVLFAGRADLALTLKAGVREGTYTRSRLRSALLITQGALSMVLLVGAGLFVRSLDHARTMRLGYDLESVLMVERNLRGEELSDSARVALRRTLVETARNLQGVEVVTWVTSVPFRSTSSTNLFVSGIDSVARLGRFTYQTATPGYFETMRTRILRGRAFGEGDRRNAPRVAVVSESMARVLWPGVEAIGQCMRVGADTMPCTTVVGVAEDAVQNELSETRRFRYYMPIDQFRPAGGSALLIRMRSDPDLSVERVRQSLQAVMPGQSYVTVRPMREILVSQRRAWQVGATMFVGFGALALLVAAVGLYGVIAYNVAQRTHELGVRTALGAQGGDIVRLIVGQGFRFALAGVGVGSALALAAARWVQPLLFDQSARDATVFVPVAAVLIAVALIASSLPAYRATRVSPNTVLRTD